MESAPSPLQALEEIEAAHEAVLEQLADLEKRVAQVLASHSPSKKPPSLEPGGSSSDCPSTKAA